MSIRPPYLKIADNVFAIQENMFILYLIKGGKQNILIDTAISAYGESISNKIRSILGDEKLDSIFLTHSHYDHTGSLPFLQNKFGSTLFGSGRTVELLEKETVRKFILELNRQFSRKLGIYEETGFPELKQLHVINNGEKIWINNDQFIEVFETPGHTKCSVSFMLMPQRILFPGDSAGVVEKNGKIKPLFLSDYVQYYSSLEKLIRLKPEILAPPHNNHTRGRDAVKAFLENSLASTQQLKSRISAALEAGSGNETILTEVLEKEFPLPTVEGPKKAFNINLTSMISAVRKSGNYGTLK